MYNLHSKKYKEFLKKLIQARKEAGLTQVLVARKLKKPQSYISKCENGERRVDFTEGSAFAKIYKKPLNYFE
jgi:transcriptional regulator with XRE-family HTH domain